ncbi:hypothetical protein L6164_027403 [Bauhinia variegata]|uniref:Uncharacterized protein n=1 Tax=Bauhinia variegata TaxID=167791 RepID=A0ACB9LSV5_BAUVA|nr:hypothetical protein L6164_027403 [Bauhinia variegata]
MAQIKAGKVCLNTIIHSSPIFSNTYIQLLLEHVNVTFITEGSSSTLNQDPTVIADNTLEMYTSSETLLYPPARQTSEEGTFSVLRQILGCLSRKFEVEKQRSN